MRIAFVSVLDPADVKNWSGTPYFMFEALKRSGHEVHAIAPLKSRFELVERLSQRCINAVSRTCYDITRTHAYARARACQASRMIKERSFDLVLCPSSIVAAYLEVDAPIVTWEDATFAGMLNYYPGKWENFSSWTIQSANQLQQRALARSAISIFASEWALDSARSSYSVSTESLAFVPFGANIEQAPDAAEIASAIENRAEAQICRLLFVGVEWARKGGDLVLATADKLRRSGVQVQVDIVGCHPPCPVPEDVIVHGFVSKATDQGRQFLRRLYQDAHFLFVPSQAECYGLVFAEASAYGIPSIAKATGGIPSVVRDGENGWTLPIDAGADVYAQKIAELISDRQRYQEMARRARQMYEETYNWDSAIRRFDAVLAPITGQGQL